MQFVAREIEVPWILGGIQSVESLDESSVEFRGYLRGCAEFEQFRQTLMKKRTYQSPNSLSAVSSPVSESGLSPVT